MKKMLQSLIILLGLSAGVAFAGSCCVGADCCTPKKECCDKATEECCNPAKDCCDD